MHHKYTEGICFRKEDLLEGNQEFYSFITDYNKVKPFLFIKVHSAGNEISPTESYPCREEKDFRITYHISLRIENGNMASTLVTDALLQRFGITMEQLHDDAIESSRKLFPPYMLPMSEILAELLDISETSDFQDSPLQVLTNRSKVFGAAVIFYPGILDQAAQTIGSGYYILPSSIHEVILYPDNMGKPVNISLLEHIVYEINREQVQQKERLSDHVYHYDPERRIMERGTEYEKQYLAKRLTQSFCC